MLEICSKLTIKTPERPFSSASIVGYEQVNVSCVRAYLQRY